MNAATSPTPDHNPQLPPHPSLWHRIKAWLAGGASQVTRQHQSAPGPHQAASLSADTAVDWIVVGLGNPGKKYAFTPHNVGYLAADELLGTTQWPPAEDLGVLGHLVELPGASGPQQVAVLRTRSYMNDSGESVAHAARAWQVPAERIIVLHDEMDIPIGTTRVKQGGSDNGHNGLKSLTEHLGSAAYLRVRIGIGRPAAGQSVIDHVLGPVDAAALPWDLKTPGRAVKLLLLEGLSATQTEIHRRK